MMRSRPATMEPEDFMGRFAPIRCSLVIWAMVLAGGSLACSRKPVVEAKQPQFAPSAFNATVPRTREADDLGRFLAGLPGKSGSPFLEFESRPEWREHAEICNRLWSQFERDRLPALEEFARVELARLPGRSETVFYPFGGPDALTVTTLFPRYPRWVLVALEPPGTPVPSG